MGTKVTKAVLEAKVKELEEKVKGYGDAIKQLEREKSSITLVKESLEKKHRQLEEKHKALEKAYEDKSQALCQLDRKMLIFNSLSRWEKFKRLIIKNDKI